MKALILILITGIFGSGDTVSTNYTAKEKFVAWNAACFSTQYKCTGVALPKVKIESMRPGLQGYYDGTDTIYIRPGLRGKRAIEVLMHEMVHYLQVQRGGLVVPGAAEPICRAENEAFGAVDSWLIEMGWDELVVGKDWWIPYTYCWPYYDPAWETYPDHIKVIWTLYPFEGE